MISVADLKSRVCVDSEAIYCTTGGGRMRTRCEHVLESSIESKVGVEWDCTGQSQGIVPIGVNKSDVLAR